ncbi:MAG: chemotaxis protein CheB [Planctomycetaceae bacterium]|nr:chemotaxis protein CheB [Planctomycetaceae bacterium]
MKAIPPTPAPALGTRAAYEVIAIGASTGGPQIVQKILASLPAGFSVPVMVVNHISAGFTAGMAKWLQQNSGPEVVIASHGDRLEPGHVYLAPEDRHLMLARRRGELVAAVNKSEPVNLFRPSVTPLMQSVAVTCGEKSIGIILSGMGGDGAVGLLDIKKAGGQTFVQSEESCVVFGMPGEAIRIGAASQTLEPDRIGPRLIQLANRGLQERN